MNRTSEDIMKMALHRARIEGMEKLRIQLNNDFTTMLQRNDVFSYLDSYIAREINDYKISYHEYPKQ
jgi:hypothetical protein